MNVNRVVFEFGCDSHLECSEYEDVAFSRLAVSAHIFWMFCLCK